jgi:SPIRAL1-like protein
VGSYPAPAGRLGSPRLVPTLVCLADTRAPCIVQNLGNFMTDRNSSRVLAPPGGRSNVSLSDGSADVAPHQAAKQHFSAPEAPLYAQIPLAQAKAAAAAQQSSSVFGGQGGQASNNYARPDSQNVGNFMTDRNTSRVLKPPGGGSSSAWPALPALCGLPLPQTHNTHSPSLCCCCCSRVRLLRPQDGDQPAGLL